MKVIFPAILIALSLSISAFAQSKELIALVDEVVATLQQTGSAVVCGGSASRIAELRDPGFNQVLSAIHKSVKFEIKGIAGATSGTQMNMSSNFCVVLINKD